MRTLIIAIVIIVFLLCASLLIIPMCALAVDANNRDNAEDALIYKLLKLL